MKIYKLCLQAGLISVVAMGMVLTSTDNVTQASTGVAVTTKAVAKPTATKTKPIHKPTTTVKPSRPANKQLKPVRTTKATTLKHQVKPAKTTKQKNAKPKATKRTAKHVVMKNQAANATKKSTKSVKNSTEYREVKTRYTTKKNKRGKTSTKQQIIRRKVVADKPAVKPVAVTSDQSDETANDKITTTPADNATTQPTTDNQNSSSAATPVLSAEDAKKNQDATNENIRLQPALTQSQIGANQGQLAYDITGSVSNVVGQGTAIVNSICQVVSTIRNLFR